VDVWCALIRRPRSLLRSVSIAQTALRPEISLIFAVLLNKEESTVNSHADTFYEKRDVLLWRLESLDRARETYHRERDRIEPMPGYEPILDTALDTVLRAVREAQTLDLKQIQARRESERRRDR
jgi:hypothetical protein